MAKILAVASGGGHWTQLRSLTGAFEGHHTVYLTTTINPATNSLNKSTRVITVLHADISEKLRMIYLAIQILWHVIWLRPDIVISTGAAPGYFAVVFGKLLGAKTIWLDSIANYDRPSLSGQKIGRFCDMFLTQWPHLKEQATYWGRVI